MRLLPREEKFYQYFTAQSQLISEAALLLVEGCRDGMLTAAERISKLEKDGDEIIHEIFRRLNVTFITPLDPEDIHRLASNLDDVLDGIEEVAHKLVAYRIKPIPMAAVQLAEVIHACAKTINLAFEALSADKPVLAHCVEINRLEEHADQVTRAAIVELLETETNAIQVIKMKEIYELLEVTTDYCENVADELENVVVKNS